MIEELKLDSSFANPIQSKDSYTRESVHAQFLAAFGPAADTLT
jgi:hypothetical protein